MFYVYIITNQKNGTLYIGHTDNLPKRIDEHEREVFKGFSQKYGLKRLVWYQTFETREEAFKKERQMKKWYRAWKIEFIEKDNPDWEDLRRDFGWLPEGA